MQAELGLWFSEASKTWTLHNLYLQRNQLDVACPMKRMNPDRSASNRRVSKKLAIYVRACLSISDQVQGTGNSDIATMVWPT